MTQMPSPYAQPMEPPPPAPPVSKTSGLAIASLILSLIFCCPGLGLVGVLLGLLALGPTGRPGVRGRGLAIAGILIGLIVSLGWGFVGYGAYRGYQFIAGEYSEKMQEFVVDFNRGDCSTAYGWTDESFRRQVSEAEFDKFMGDIRDEWGNAKMVGFMEAMKAFQSMPPQVQQQVQQQQQQETAVLPVPIRFDKAGLKWLLLEIDQGQDRLMIRRFTFVGYGTLPRDNPTTRKTE